MPPGAAAVALNALGDDPARLLAPWLLGFFSKDPAIVAGGAVLLLEVLREAPPQTLRVRADLRARPDEPPRGQIHAFELALDANATWETLPPWQRTRRMPVCSASTSCRWASTPVVSKRILSSPVPRTLLPWRRLTTPNGDIVRMQWLIRSR